MSRASANTVPAIGWMLLEILMRPDLLERVRKEIAPYVSRDPSDPSQFAIDIPNLCAQPLIQSIYAEVLRLRSGTVVNRVPTSSNLHIGGWHLKKGEPVIVSSYNAGRDPSVWNQGTFDEPHPIDEFWPERFIVHPDDPNSGPVLKSSRQQQAKQGGEDLKHSKPLFSLDGTAGSWIPYGGGARMCPGRHFAKKEMIVNMAMFLTAFDIELTDPETRIQPDLSYFMFGVMHPVGKIPARIRRRDF
jgi:cytochrome P450